MVCFRFHYSIPGVPPEPKTFEELVAMLKQMGQTLSDEQLTAMKAEVRMANNCPRGVSDDFSVGVVCCVVCV